MKISRNVLVFMNLIINQMQEKLIAGLTSSYGSLLGQQYLKWLKMPPSYLRVMQSIDYRKGMYGSLANKGKSIDNAYIDGEVFHKCGIQLQTIASQIAHKISGGKVEQQYLVTGLLKIILQVFVHQKDQSLTHSPFANMIQPPNTPLLWPQTVIDLITSRNLASLIEGTLLQCQSMYNELQLSKVYGLTALEFLKLFQSVRASLICFNPQKPKYFDMQSVQIVCPIVYQFDHSFDPNCYLDGCYLSHENMSFVDFSAKKQIEPGDKLTINYGNLSNHDLLMRHGIIADENPYNEMPIDLDFTTAINYTEQLFEQKQKWLRQSEITNIERQSLYANKINVQLLQYLRIYFLTEQEFSKNPQMEFNSFQEKVSEENELLVKQFMIQNIKNILSTYKQISKPVGKELQDLYKIQKDEMTILQNNLTFFSK
ncbi:unnamed protein product (macronuclear) [Paramecium tetraurelia]|uniref:Rubisco LSMT substrate-binding domain-containing protein n=1 Tax=Paramecium tetraurelia TaxID=5888 RepID=A0D5J8_PARTE|nr:uncharacterized protein GSPATT00013745001 [Paramecium tetraurelia]CAK78315.1 unnamed protein product [Paramecium tetraurelia]|eukprot:XP_001445712.1 hypothetical protein (macronuclear) [Paramecium tetraurelia strain d4-2]